MNIPNTLKVGGMTYAVELTQSLDNGRNSTDGEIDYREQSIRINNSLSDDRIERTFLHEMLHAAHDFLGYIEHDEKKIDELANVLHMIITDNPKVFAPEETAMDG